MSASIIPKARPYWHVDAKWISGILLLFLLNLTFLLFLLYQITAAERGIPLLTQFLASAYSPEGLDDASGLELMHQKIAESPNGAWQPIPGLNIQVRQADISGMTPRQARLWFFRQLAEPIYNEGAAGLARLATDPATEASLAGGVGPLGLISAQTHRQVQAGLAVGGLAALVLLVLLIIFSYRFGRFGSPGCVIFLAAAPGLLLFGAARGWLDGPAPVLAADREPSLAMRFTLLAKEALPGTIQYGWQIYVTLVLLGLGLLFIALLSAIIWRQPKQISE